MTGDFVVEKSIARLLPRLDMVGMDVQQGIHEQRLRRSTGSHALRWYCQDDMEADWHQSPGYSVNGTECAADHRDSSWIRHIKAGTQHISNNGMISFAPPVTLSGFTAIVRNTISVVDCNSLALAILTTARTKR